MTSGSVDRPTPLAIIGIGCLFPKAGNAHAFWLNVKHGVDAIGPVPPSHWNPHDFLDADPKAPDRTYAARGGFLDPVDFRPLDFGIAPNDLEAIDTAQLLGLVAARQALLDAGYRPDSAFDRSRVSVILGVTGTLELVIPLGARLGHPRWRKALANAGVPAEQAEEVVREIADSYVGWQENSFPGLLGNVVAGRIANRLDLGGTNCVVDAACASSLSAIHLAGLELAAGRCDLAVTGGVDTFNDIFMYMCFSKTPALSPTGDAKPFDAQADGTILGEGLGIVVLKRLTDAERDRDRIYAVIRGLGSSSDGKGNAVYAPSSAGQVKALRNAYELSGISPATVELVEAHGTGTRVGDAAEVAALTEVYRDARADGTWCALGSVKSQIGHTKAAAGAAGLIKAALALHYKVLPPTIKVDKPIDPLTDNGTSPFYVNTEKRPWPAQASHPRRAAISAFGFGGSNFHCVLEEADRAKSEVDWDDDVEIIALSSDSLDGLKKNLNDWRVPCSWSELNKAAAASRARFSVNDLFRAVMVATRDGQDLTKTVAAIDAHLDKTATSRSGHLPEGAHVGCGPAPGRLAVLFPGQGSQHVGMLRDLACLFPEMLDVLDDANRVFARMAGDSSARLSDLIYSHPTFSNEARHRQEQLLRDTQVAQPAIGAVSIGALKVLERFGVTPDAYAGHSYGELPALCAAGCFDEQALHTMSRLRGHLMAGYHGGDTGAMLAVHAPLTTIEAMLREERLDLVVANRNAPSQSVLSGSSAEIDRAAEGLDRRKLRHTRLPVAAAFHSPLVAPASLPFREALDTLTFRAARAPVFANTTGREYPETPLAIRELLAGQLAAPVDFVREIGCMIEGGVRTFLEVGPGSTLTRLVAAILADHDDSVWACDAFALDSSAGKRSGLLDLAHVLARLAARGHAVDLKGWRRSGAPDRQQVESAKPGLVVPICGANYVSPKTHKPKETAEAATSIPLRPEVLAAQPMQEPTRLPSKPAVEARETANPEALVQALQITQQSLAAFQKLQEQTAQLHKQFLDTQASAQRTLQMLVDQQQALVLGRVPLVAPRAANEAPTLPPSAIVPSYPASSNGAVQAIRAEVESPLPQHSTVNVLIEIVAEKTGYPPDMLSPEMAIDSDLGIDSIKRVEIFSALQERLPEAPAVRPEHLGSLQTLQDVIEFLDRGQSTADPERGVSQKQTVPSLNDRPRDGSLAQDTLLAVVSEKTGYPPEMLALEMALDSDLGIDSIKRVEIFSALQERLPDAPVVKPEHLGSLRTLGDVAQFLSAQPGKTPPHKPVASPKGPPAREEPRANALPPAVIERSILQVVPLEGGNADQALCLPAGARVLLVGDDPPLLTDLASAVTHAGCRPHIASWEQTPDNVDLEGVAGLIVIAPLATAHDDLALPAFRWMRAVGPSLKQAARDGVALFATVTQLGGRFGVGDLCMEADACQGALTGLAKTAAKEWTDVTCKTIDIDPAESAELGRQLWEQLLRVGPVEVGLTSSGAIALELRPCRQSLSAGPAALTPDDVVLITGGARGVTAEAAVAIAERFRPTIVILGRTSLEEQEHECLRGCLKEAALKQALRQLLSSSTTLKEIEAAYRNVVAAREVRSNLARMRDAGARVQYCNVDVLQAAEVEQSIREIHSKYGPVTAVVHGAGVLADHRIQDLTDDDFARVYDTKVASLENVLRTLRNDPLKAVVLFSSSTARFGRVGQAAYAAANEALNKFAQREARRRESCRVVSINWGPWDGGMVTPSLRALFASEGVGVIPLREGGEFLVRELSTPHDEVEVTVIARPAATPIKPVAEAAPLNLAFEQTFDLENLPILRSHVFDNRAVTPLALQMEWLAHAALHGNPGLMFHGVDNVRVLNGLHLTAEEKASIVALAGRPERCGTGFAVSVELHSRRPERDVVHSRAEVILVSKLPAPEAAPPLSPLPAYPHSVQDAYRNFLFHGRDLAGIERIEGLSESAIAATCRPAPGPTAWQRQPLRSSWLADPLTIDAAFQLMILWSFDQHGVGCLPCAVGHYRQYRRSFPANGVRVVAHIKKVTGSLIRADIEFIDESGILVARMTDHESVMDEGLHAAFRRNRLPAPALEGSAER
jgi:acyl transferase domain-containing protein